MEADRRLLRRPGEGLQDRLVRRRQSLQELGTGRGARRGEHLDGRRQAHRVPRLRQCVGRQHRPADQAARRREGHLLRPRTPLAHARLLHVARGVQGRQRRLDGGRRSRRHERGGQRLHGRELQDQQGRRQHGRRRRLPARSVHLGGRLSRHEHDRDAGVRRPEHDGQFRPEPVRRVPGRRLGQQLHLRRDGHGADSRKRRLDVRRRVGRRVQREAHAPRQELGLGKPRLAWLRTLDRHVQPRGGRLRGGGPLLQRRRWLRDRLQRREGPYGLQRRDVPARRNGQCRPRRRAWRAGRGGRLGRDGRPVEDARVADEVHARRDAGRGGRFPPPRQVRRRLLRARERHARRLRRGICGASGGRCAPGAGVRGRPGARRQGHQHA